MQRLQVSSSAVLLSSERCSNAGFISMHSSFRQKGLCKFPKCLVEFSTSVLKNVRISPILFERNVRHPVIATFCPPLQVPEHSPKTAR